MLKLVLVFLGSGLGGVARHQLNRFVLHHAIDWRFPLSTFLVNASGCLAMGLLAGLVERHHLFSADARLFLFTGLLGGYTTFSTFGLETTLLLRRGDLGVALGYVALSVLGGIAGLWLGMAIIPPGIPPGRP